MSAAAGAYFVAVAADAEAAAAEAAAADEDAAAAAIDAEATLHTGNPTTSDDLLLARSVAVHVQPSHTSPYRIPLWFNADPKLFLLRQTYPEVNSIVSRTGSEFTKV